MEDSSSGPRTLTHPISPPRKRRRLPNREEPRPEAGTSTATPKRTFRSPFQLTKIRDLPDELNKDTVSLSDILGDPLISECWSFNYLHDIDFTLAAFDEDVRHLVRLHVVHGFWKKEDPRRLQLEAASSRHQNVSLHSAYLPEMFGTHHSKMMILFRRDETAQVIIHTANMIVRDWANMTQAVWSSPPLPLLNQGGQDTPPYENLRMGSGARFKQDLLNYLRSYDKNRRTCRPLIEELTKYDFSSVRGALIASVPGRFRADDDEGDSPTTATTRWGWAAMRQALKAVPVRAGKAEVVVQISSIATLGPTDSWLKKTFFQALSGGSKPDFKVVFPTPDEIRRSLDGYASGGSIHTKIQSGQQAKQLQYLRPLFCHWGNDCADGEELDNATNIREAGRRRAAPHIKTYIRYAKGSSSHGGRDIDWALVTSANLSKQAWGDSAKGGGGSSTNSTGEMLRVSSYEIGVLVWPELFAEGAVMRGTFLTDTIDEAKDRGEDKHEGRDEDDDDKDKPVVALRIPYNLPLQAYGKQEVPWVATANYTEPDWRGRVWRDNDG